MQESDSCLYITRDISSGEFNANTRRFFWDLVRVIQIPDIWNTYTSMSFTFMSGDDMANVGISGYNNVYSFNATHINLMQDQNKNSIFDQFYMAVLGARDLSVAQDKSLYEMAEKYGTSGYSLPEDYRSGYFWVMSSFPYNAGYSVSDTTISVQVSAENTKQCGAQSAQELTAAVDIFNQLCNNDPLSMPYTKISVQYLDSNNSKLWDWCSEKSGGTWSVTQNSSNSVAFADGIHSTSR